MRRIVLLVALAIPTTARAHFKLVAPEAMHAQNGLGDPQKSPPCGPAGEGGTPTNKVTTVMAGSMLTLTVDETIYHPGHYRVAIAPTEADLPKDPAVTTGSTACGSAAIAQNPTLPVLADLLVHTKAFSGPQTVQVPIPAGMTCNNCVVQVLEFMSDHAAPCFYYHCARVNVVAAGAMPDAGVGAGEPNTSDGGCSTGRGVGSAATLLLLALLRRRRGRA